MTAAGKPLFRTFKGAARVNAYTLARAWADRSRGPVLPADRTVDHELDEIAVTAALKAWLTRWQPLNIHHALHAGASIEEVAEAAGVEFQDVTRVWRQWSDGQRRLQHDTPTLPDHTAQYDRVADLIHRAAVDRAQPNPVGNLRVDRP